MDSQESAADAHKRQQQESEDLLRRSKELLQALEKQIEETRELLAQANTATPAPIMPSRN